MDIRLPAKRLCQLGVVALLAGMLGVGALAVTPVGAGTAPSPARVVGAPGNASLAVGGFHSCALAAAGTVMCWGLDREGQLGVAPGGLPTCSNNPCSTTPVQVLTKVGGPPLTGVAAIAAGSEDTCALLAVGTVYCWGDSRYGALGNGTFGGVSPPKCEAGADPCSSTPVEVLTSVDGLPLTGVTAIAMSGTGIGDHVCALLAAGSVDCWGSNDYGELGDGTDSGTLCSTSAKVYCEPTPVPVLTSVNPRNLLMGVTALSASFHHTCALLSLGTAYCWGLNADGQLGDGTTHTRSIATQVVSKAAGGSGLIGVSAISAGGNGNGEHTCALLAAGTIDCWGYDLYKQLGDANRPSGNKLVPTPVVLTSASNSPQLSDVTAIAAGGWHTCASLADGTMKCWGLNDSDQLGDGNPSSSATPQTVLDSTGAPLSGVTAAGAGFQYSCATLGEGAIVCWGKNANGQLGDNDPTLGFKNKATPVSDISVPNAVTAITAGSAHTCDLLAAGSVECWGQNIFGQLGINNNAGANVVSPMQVKTADGSALTGVIAIAAGADHTCALLTAGTVDCWGLNTDGQLGVPIGPPACAPTPISALSAPCSAAAVPVVGLSDVSAITAGANHTCALSAVGGVVDCWGDDSFGQLGIGVIGAATSTPMPVNGLSDVSEISANGNHTCALLSIGFVGGIHPLGGTVDCWGDNTSGQLGDGLVGAPQPTPTQVNPLGGVSAIAAGQNHTCALIGTGTPAGTVECWGANTSGQLGDGIVNNHPQPTPIQVKGNLNGVTAITAGANHTCALVASGQPLPFAANGGIVRCWGDNTDDQLGNANATHQPVPATVRASNSVLSGVIAIAAGDNHSCALQAAGRTTTAAQNGGVIDCWGLGNLGQLGNGAFNGPTATPVPVIGH